MNFRIPLLLLCCAALAFTAPSAPAQAPGEVHGSGDAYAAPGLALAWAVLRGADDAATLVVVRVIADPQVYPWIGVTASNPFSQRQLQVLRHMQTSGSIDLRVPRAQFADFPRTEWRFYNAAPAPQAAAPTLIVFYLGVPDTTPEFTSEAMLDAYLADRLTRVRGGVR